MEPNQDTSMAGFLNIDPTVTPLNGNWYGPTADRTFTLYTGEGTYANGTTFIDPTIIGNIRSVDSGSTNVGPWAFLKS